MKNEPAAYPMKPLVAPMFAHHAQFSDFEQIIGAGWTIEVYLVTYLARTLEFNHFATVWVGRRFVGHGMVQAVTADTRKEALDKVS